MSEHLEGTGTPAGSEHTDDDGMFAHLLEGEPETPATQPTQPEQQSFVRWLAETALLILAAFILAQGIKTFVVQPFVVPTGSMIPTIEINDRVIAEKISYRFRDPKVGEVVVFSDPSGQYPQLIKRVIATAGQTIDIRMDGVYVDGKKLDEPYVHGLQTDPGPVSTPLVVPDGQLWLMGDNRPFSGDSRFIGPQPVSAVKGHAFFTYWPPSRMGVLE